MFFRLAASKLTVASQLKSRALSSKGIVAVAKLRSILEEYRLENYTQELPARFKKEVVRAAAPEPSTEVHVDGFLSVLKNIGADETRISSAELKMIFDELGNGTGKIPSSQMVQII